jgi:hypothetical protein
VARAQILMAGDWVTDIQLVEDESPATLPWSVAQISVAGSGFDPFDPEVVAAYAQTMADRAEWDEPWTLESLHGPGGLAALDSDVNELLEFVFGEAGG